MIHVIASIHVKTGYLPGFIAIFKTNVPKVLEEKGCLEYLPTADFPTGLPPQEMDGNIVTILEKWNSLEDLQAHLSAPHMLKYKDDVQHMVDKVTLKVLEAV